VTELRSFTRIPLKAQLYARETYFREGLRDAIEVFGENAAAALRKAAILLVKPDGLASGKASTVVSFLRANDFSIVAVELASLDRLHWRELWRYQLTSATLDRLAINDLVLRDQALLLMLRHNGDLDVPAAVWLSGLKGPSDISSQGAGCLRRLLAQPNRIFSFIHVADEPADVLRELAVMLDDATRWRVLSAFANGAISSADQNVLDETLATSDRTARALDIQVSLRRVEHALSIVGSGKLSTKAAKGQVLADLDLMRRGERILWHPFVHALAATGVRLDRWDLATLGANFIVYDEPGASKLIKAVDPKLWSPESEEGAARPLEA
jgi:hypothetical protein